MRGTLCELLEPLIFNKKIIKKNALFKSTILKNFLDFGEFFEMSLQSIGRDEKPQEWIEQIWVCMRLTSGLA